MKKSKICKTSTYQVENILERRIVKNNDVFYKVKWLGYPESGATWEPMSNLTNVKYLISKFNNKHYSSEREDEKNVNKFKVKK